MLGDYLIMIIGALVVLLVLWAALWPRLRQYRLTIRKIGHKKHRRAKPAKKQKKHVWIKVI